MNNEGYFETNNPTNFTVGIHKPIVGGSTLGLSWIGVIKIIVAVVVVILDIKTLNIPLTSPLFFVPMGIWTLWIIPISRKTTVLGFIIQMIRFYFFTPRKKFNSQTGMIKIKKYFNFLERNSLNIQEQKKEKELIKEISKFDAISRQEGK